MKIRKLLTFLSVLMLLASTASAANIILSGSESYTAQNGDVLTGSTSGTVTIANNAKITLSDATITGGIICEGNATITLVGNNNVTGKFYYAGVQVGGSGTTLTIKGDGSLTATGGDYGAGIGTDGIYHQDAICGNIVIESGTIIAQGGEPGGAGIGTGFAYTYHTLPPVTKHMGDIVIKGGIITAIGGDYADIVADGIGCGIAANYGTTIVDNIIIYDGITKVEASRIGKSPVFMHETTDVTTNKSEYFAIMEIGDRRVIAPKDNTDYTITIADGFQNGTVSCTKTANYLDKVTITATPDFGYRLSGLVVKDADNNDVELFANSFFMPKSNVTVSAVFEQGVHGTTEFVLGYDLPDGYEKEATIYDGVTTVNLQSGISYTIGKDYHEDVDRWVESSFLLDNDINSVDIPYAGGTGTFKMVGTNFALRYGATAGYYDITMTDVGNGKWNVSIQKTAGQMDVVPDQTYTGSEIKPEPLVMAGSLNLTKGTDYVYSYTNNTNAGTATVTVTFKGDYASLGSVEKDFNIVNLTSENVSDIPAQTYTGSAITPKIVVTDGETTLTLGTDYTVSYSDNINAGTAKATITGKGNYYGEIEKTFIINAKTLVASNVSDIPAQTYTGSAIEPEIICDGITLVKGTDYDVLYSDNTNVGTAKATITGKGNYTGSIEKNFTILPAPVTVTAENQTKTFGESDPEFTATVTGLVNNECPDLITYTFTRTEGENVGEYTITPKGDEKQGNYVVSFVDGKLTINPAPVTVTAENKTKTFGESDPEFTAIVTGLVNNESPDLIKYTLTRTEGENAGEYTITPKGDEKQGNYVVSFVDATLTITKATPNPEPEPQNPSTPVSSVDNNGSNVKVWSYAHTIYIASTPDSQYKIIDLQGRTIKSATTKSSYEEVNINKSGILVVIINGKSYKVSL